MPDLGSCPPVLVSLLCFLLLQHSTWSFSLKNCTISDSDDENGNDVYVSCDYRYLTVIPDDIPQNAVSLNLCENHITRITRAELRGLSKLVTAQFDVNRISAVEDEAFADMVELRFLSMNDNKLTNLTEKMFQGLSKLEELYLSDNEISFLTPRAFQSLPRLRSVGLTNNYLSKMTDIHPILKLPALISLQLAFNRLEYFQTDRIPVKLSNLTYLDLSLNFLRKFSITRHVFPNLSSLVFNECGYNIQWDVKNKTFLRSLTRLSLSGIYISFDSYRAILQTTSSLKQLEFSNMKSWLDQGLVETACQIPSLRTLVLTGCSLKTIDDKLLQSCSQITHLNLNFNSLLEMFEHSLQSLTQLRILSMSNNELSKLPVTIRGISTLEVLDLSYNSVKELDCLDFKNLTNLTSLNLQNNHVSTLQGCLFENLKELKELNLRLNSLDFVGNAFKLNLQKLESLNLDKNDFKAIRDGDFRSLFSLQELNLQTDDSYRIDHEALEGLGNLQTLRITCPFLTVIFESLQSLQNLSIVLVFNDHHNSHRRDDDSPFSNLTLLKRLEIKKQTTDKGGTSTDLLSGLRSLEFFRAENFFKESVHLDTFRFTPKLKNLQIVHSDLSDLTPELFWYIPDLKELDLSNNKLKSLDFLAQAKLLALSVLKLSNNDLSVINETVFQFLPALRYLDLSDNPLTCECSNSGFMQWIQTNNQTQVVNGYQYICAFPVRRQEEHFLDFDVHSCWMDRSFLCFISSTCLIMFVLLTSFIYHFLRWHLTYAYYLFLAFLYDNSRKKAGTPHRYDAFISYNVHDEAWVYRELLPVLEGQQGWRLCLHHRDFEPGKAIVENITDAIYSSRKTLCVISHHYLQSEWCSREIQMAR
uniref:Toll-like receptor 13 n=1 Tax=Gouania willdenowi TaxID=441366 RepID=A0A8C5GLV7_GOUWI